jgi:hypothetical protein
MQLGGYGGRIKGTNVKTNTWGENIEKKGGKKEVEEGEVFKYEWFLNRKRDIIKIGKGKICQTRNLFYLNFKKKTTNIRGRRLWACGVL